MAQMATPDVQSMIRELMEFEEPGWDAGLAAIPAWHPRNEDPPAPTADPPAADPPASDPPADPPANEPEVFDREYVSNLRKENAKYRTRAKRADELEAELETQRQAELSELEREKAAREKAEKDAAKLRHDALRRKVADKHKLDGDMAEFLVGDTEEELDAKAAVLAARVQAAPSPAPPSVPGGPQGAGGASVITADEARSLAKKDPTKFNEMFEAGEIPASALAPK